MTSLGIDLGGLELPQNDDDIQAYEIDENYSQDDGLQFYQKDQLHEKILEPKESPLVADKISKVKQIFQ